MARKALELTDANFTQLLATSADKDSLVQRVARELGSAKAHGGLLPEDEARYVRQLAARLMPCRCFQEARHELVNHVVARRDYRREVAGTGLR